MTVSSRSRWPTFEFIHELNQKESLDQILPSFLDSLYSYGLNLCNTFCHHSLTGCRVRLLTRKCDRQMESQTDDLGEVGQKVGQYDLEKWVKK